MAEKSILGIDLRVCSVKVVEIKKGTKGYIIAGWGMEEVPIDLVDKHPEKEVAQARALQKIIAQNRIKTKEAVVVVGGSDVLVKKLSLPALSAGEAHEAIKWKIKDEISYPLEDAVVDFFPLRKVKGKDEVEYVAAVAHRETVTRVLDIMRMAQVKLLSIVPVPLAMKETFAEQMSSEEDVNSVIYIGRRTTNISFFKGRSFLFNREITLGGEDITKAMTSVVVSEEGRLELKFEEAEKIKTEYGIPIDLETYPKLGEIPLAHLQAVVRPALEKVEDELLRTLEYFKGQEGEVEIKKVILCGGSSRTPHLLEFLSSGLGLPFEYIDPIKDLIVDTRVKEKASLAAHSAQLAAALGAALSHYDKGLNLLPEEIRDRWKLLVRKHSNPLELSIAIAVIMVCTYAFMFARTFYLKGQIDTVKDQINQLAPKLSRLEELEKAMREEEGRRGVFKTIELNRIKIPEVLEDISLNIPESIITNQISIVESSRSMVIKGTVFQKGDTAENILSKFIMELSSAPSFSNVELIQATKNDGYSYPAFDFEIDGQLKNRT
ncbi:MAG TPA: type IV pilus assembly protein PilM [Candidatus Omnitrophota bacterium]|nr:type IV pilus assembly protein PilM [Candidatus Omnitrophota bacterium]